MTDRLAEAQAALNAGRRNEAIEHLIAAVAEDPARPVQVYRVLVLKLYSTSRFDEAETYARQALARYPRDYELLNTRGVLLRKLRRQAEAVGVLEQAIKLNPKAPAAQNNLGNVLLDLGDGARGEKIFSQLARTAPRDAEYQRQLGRALARQGKVGPALVRFRQAVSLKRDNIEAWLDLAGLLAEEHREDEVEATLGKALEANPRNERLLEGRIVLARRFGNLMAAEEYLTALQATLPEAAWVPYQFGILIADRDRVQANKHLQRACQLAPERLDYQVSLIESLERTRAGDEGANIEHAYQLALPLLSRKSELSESATKILCDVFTRVCDFESLSTLGDFRALGRSWAETGRHAALLKQMSRVRTRDDRLELVEQHRIWGRKTQAVADRNPIQRVRSSSGDKLRIGFMSSDLRRHPVGYFAMPLFEHFDRQRFEVFAYSFYTGQADPAQRRMSQLVTGFRWWPEISTREAADRIAAEGLDILIELGGSTHMNKLDVMAYRPAQRQASWLGYPHSAGLDSIDYFVCDPFIAPEDPRLIIETPLMLPNAWYPLSAAFFRDEPAADPVPPIARNGYATFGTANQPHKCTEEVLRAWARIMRAATDSRFLFIRPEGSSEAFRSKIRRVFETEGVSGQRIDFEPVRGAHLPHYNRIDISLDTFPQTGGTTTCESLWMGAPCITLVGASPFERLSNSVLRNAGLDRFCTQSVEDYEAAAVRLAADPVEIADLRRTLRERLRSSPMGQEVNWARDYFDAVKSALGARI